MTIWYVGTGGSDNNGGTSDTDAAKETGTAGDVDNSPTPTILTDSAATFVTNGVAVGDGVNIISGTGVNAGIYLVAIVDSEIQLTLTGDAGDSAGAGDVTYNVGGRLVTIQAAHDEVAAGGDEIKVNAGTYTEQVDLDNSGVNANLNLLTAVGAAIIDGESTRTNCIDITGHYWLIKGFELKNATSHGATASANNNFFVECYAHNNGGSGFNKSALIGCRSGNNSSTGFASLSSGAYCYSHDNGAYGFTSCNRLAFCISDTDDIAGFWGSSSLDYPLWVHCVAYNNDADGFRAASSTGVNYVLLNSIAMSNAGQGIDTESSLLGRNNILFNNTGGASEGEYHTEGDLTSDPDFADAPGGDFSIPTTSPAYEAGYPQGVSPPDGDGAKNKPHIGAVHPVDPAGGGGGGTVNLLRGKVG